MAIRPPWLKSESLGGVFWGGHRWSILKWPSGFSKSEEPQFQKQITHDFSFQPTIQFDSQQNFTRFNNIFKGSCIRYIVTEEGRQGRFPFASK